MNKQQQINAVRQAIRSIHFLDEQDTLDILTTIASAINGSVSMTPSLKESLVDQLDETIGYLESEIQFVNDQIQELIESGEYYK